MTATLIQSGNCQTHAADTMPQAARTPHILVLGAGFAGLAFVNNFPKNLARITLIDRTNHHLFQPLLYQVAAAGLAVPDIAQPVRSILSARQDVTVLMNEVTAIDLAKRRVAFEQTQLDYDYLVVALGGRTSYFGHPEWEPHAPGLKSVGDALRIRASVLHALERAEVTDDLEERQRLLRIVVIGGGPTGVELAGAFAELHRHVLKRDFRRARSSTGEVILIEAGPRLLHAFSPALSEKARRHLESLGVVVRTGARVKDIQSGNVVLDGETLHAANIIWAAGVSANPLSDTLGVPLDRAGRVRVASDLSIPGQPRAFVIGDLASAIDERGVAAPGTSPAAIQMGAYVARAIATELRPAARKCTERRPFRFRDLGAMATIGRSRAVARIGRMEISGPAAWLLWLFVHLLSLVGFRNKLLVFTQWVYSYVTYQPGARVIHGSATRNPPGPSMTRGIASAGPSFATR